MHRSEQFAGATHIATLDGHSRYFTPDSYEEACNELVTGAHGGVPKVTQLFPVTEESITKSMDAEVRPEFKLPTTETEMLSTYVATPKADPEVEGGELDTIGRDRSQVDTDAAAKAGFAMEQPIYARGTRVIALGVENARSSRLEHDEKPTVAEYCNDLIQQVRAEERSDVSTIVRDTRMTKDGDLAARHLRLPMSNHAFGQFLTRSGISGNSYLSKCTPELRAINVNHWCKSMKDKQELILRTRNNSDANGGREVFGVVTPKYQAFDVDRIATAIQMSAPDDARGTVTYDGTKARFEVLFHSNIEPEHYVAGEHFKAGVIIRTDDTGSGSIKVSAVVWQNLCLNLIIVDQAEKETARIKHVGSVYQLSRKLEAGFAAALDKIDHFRSAWGYAVEDDIVQDLQGLACDVAMKMKTEEILPGIFNGIIERDLVPVRGNRKQVVSDLMKMYSLDKSGAVLGRENLSRAAVINAFTRYAHTIEPARGPWGEDELQKAAGQLLFGRKPTSNPAPLPYQSLSV